MPVLREKFADRYVSLFCRHGLRRDGAALWLFTCFVDVRHIYVLFHFARLYFDTHEATCWPHGAQHQDPRLVTTSRPRGSYRSSSRTARIESDTVIYRVLKALLAAEIPFSSFDGNVSEEELDLFEFASSLMAETRTCSAKIVRSEP